MKRKKEQQFPFSILILRRKIAERFLRGLSGRKKRFLRLKCQGLDGMMGLPDEFAEEEGQ